MIGRDLLRGLAALAVAAVAYGFAVGGHAERLTGGEATLRYEVRLSSEALADGPAAIERTWRQRLRGYEVAIELGDRGAGDMVVVVEVTGAPAEKAEPIARALDTRGAMEMRWVVNDTPTAQRWFATFGERAGQGHRADGVRALPDSWQADRPVPHIFDDYYVEGPTRGAIAAALAEQEPPNPVPADLELMYEDVTRRSDDGASTSHYVRTYLVERTPILTQADLASAVVTYDSNTLRPEVGVTFTRAGGQRFGDETDRRTGWKLAMIVDGRVESAPIVMGAIRGGRSTITMGGGAADVQEAQAAGLAAALSGGGGGVPLPPGIHARLIDIDSGRHVRDGTRLAIALLAGALAWFAAPRLRRVGLDVVPLGAPGVRVPAPAVGATALAIAVTVLVPLALIWVGRHVLLPGLSEEAFEAMARGRGRAGYAQVGILALGIMPLVSAYWLTELVALAVPRWRRVRLGTAAERRPIDLLAVVLTAGLAALQAYFILAYFDSLGARGYQMIVGGTLMRIALVATLVGGAMTYLVAAQLVSRFGLTNGVLVLVSTGAAMRLWDARPHGDADPRWMLVAVLAAIAVLAALVARVRAGGRRLPWAGVVPIVVVGLAIALLSLPAMAWPDAARWIGKLYGRPWWVDVAVAIAILGVIAGERRAALAPLPIAISVGFVLALCAAPYLVAAPLRLGVDVIAMVTLGVTVLELIAGLRARLRGATAVVAVVHDVDRADRIATALGDAGIDHAVLGVHARAILRLLGAYCPIVVRVAEADAARARSLAA